MENSTYNQHVNTSIPVIQSDAEKSKGWEDVVKILNEHGVNGNDAWLIGYGICAWAYNAVSISKDIHLGKVSLVLNGIPYVMGGLVNYIEQDEILG